MDVCNLTHDSTVFTSNAYLIFGERTTLIDVGSDPDTLEKIYRQTSTIDSILLTHQHPDHIGSLHEIMDAFQPELYCHADHPLQTSKLNNGQKILIGDEWYKTLHTPGHSKDHLVFLNSDSIFTGDVIVYSDSAFNRGSFGRTDLPGGSREDLICSIESILSNSSPNMTNMYSGHGPIFHGNVVEVITTALTRAKKRKPKFSITVMLQLDQNIQEKAFDLVHSLTPYWKETLREDLLGYYVLGSLAHGGFNRRYSDIDIAVISENGLSEEMIEDAQKFAVQLSPSLGPKLSIFWSNRNFSEGRMRVLDRIDYIDHAKAISENEWVNPKRPTKKEIYEYLSGEPLENWRQTAAYFILQDKLLPEEHKKYLRAHLYAARFAYSWLTLNIGSNDTAVTFLAENPVKGLKMDLIFRALECRHKADDPDRLFSDRKLLLEQIEACLNLTFLHSVN